MNLDLLTTQKNQIFRILDNRGLFPSEFYWSKETKDYTSSPTSVLIHKNSNFYFLFLPPENSNSLWHFKCTPGDESPVSSGICDYGWSDILKEFDDWALNLRAELNEADLWASFKNIDLQTLNLEENENDSFNYVESSAITPKIKELIKYLETESESNSKLSGKLDNIVSSLERLDQHAKSGLGRIDWTNQLVGLVVNIVVAGTMSPERASDFLKYVRILFSTGINLLIKG